MTEKPSTDRPTIIIDLDGTILDRCLPESLRLYLTSSAKTGRIFPAARAKLEDLAGIAHIVGVTARCYLCKKNTDAWLADNGLSFVPSYHAPFFQVCEPQRAKTKRGLIQAVREAGYDPRFGVGDRGSDLDAYIEEGLFPVMVSNRPGKRIDQLLERIKARGLVEKQDYVLFHLTNPGPQLWEQVATYIREQVNQAQP